MKIEDILKRLRLEFVAMWVVAGILAACHETGLFPEGSCAETPTLAYVIETAAVLLTLAGVPAAVKISGKFMYGRVLAKEGEEKLKTILRWSEIQLFLLAIVTLTDISIYYATMESLGILCAAVALVASLLCLPDRVRFEKYLSAPKPDQP